MRAALEARAPQTRGWAGRRVVTPVEGAKDYYIAEAYHQQYLARGGRFGIPQSAEKGATDKIRYGACFFVLIEVCLAAGWRRADCRRRRTPGAQSLAPSSRHAHTQPHKHEHSLQVLRVMRLSRVAAPTVRAARASRRRSLGVIKAGARGGVRGARRDAAQQLRRFIRLCC